MIISHAFCCQVACHEGMAKARRTLGDEWLADAHMDEAKAIRYGCCGVVFAYV